MLKKLYIAMLASCFATCQHMAEFINVYRMLQFACASIASYLHLDLLSTIPSLPAFFPGQNTHQHGHSMCTTASFFWLLAVIRFDLAAAPPPEAMHKLLAHAAAVHHDVLCALRRARKLPLGTNFLNHEEVINASKLPSDVTSTPMAGHQLDYDPDPDFAALGPTLHRRDLFDRVGTSEGFLLTANNHTVAFCANASGVRLFFDSVPAVVHPVLNARDLNTLLEQHLGHFENFDCTYVRVSHSQQKHIKMCS